MELIAGPHRGDDGDSTVIGFVDDGDLSTRRVDGIDDVVGSGLGNEALVTSGK